MGKWFLKHPFVSLGTIFVFNAVVLGILAWVHFSPSGDISDELFFGFSRAERARKLHGQGYRCKSDDTAEALKKSLAEKRSRLGDAHPEVVRAMERLADRYMWSYDREEAKPLYKLALSIRATTKMPEDWSTAMTQQRLGQCYERVGEYGDAERLFLESLAIKERVLEPSDCDLIRSRLMLATFFVERDRYDEAAKLYESAARVIDKELFGECYDVSRDLETLADAYRGKKCYGEAEDIYKRKVSLAQDSSRYFYGSDAAQGLCALAACYADQEKNELAGETYEKALLVLESDDHARGFDVTRVCTGYGDFLGARGDLEAAAKMVERGAALVEKVETEDPSRDLGVLASSLERWQRWDGAERLHRRALALKEQSAGGQPEKLVDCTVELARCLAGRGRGKEALDLYGRAWSTVSVLDNPEPDLVVISAAGYGSASARWGVPDESKSVAARALEILASYPGEDEDRMEKVSDLVDRWNGGGDPGGAAHVCSMWVSMREKQLGNGAELAAEMEDLADTLRGAHIYDAAEALYRRALDGYVRSRGAVTAESAGVWHQLGHCFEWQEKYEPAESCFARALEIFQKISGPEDEDTIRMTKDLADCRLSLKRYAAAEPLYKRLLALSKDTVWPDEIDKGAVAGSYAELLRRTGRRAEAEKLQQR